MRVRGRTGGRVAERSESSNPMIASGNHTDSNSDRPYGVRGIVRGAEVERRMADGERPDRRQWREEGGERLAAVGERRRCVSTEDIRRAPQQGHPYEAGGNAGCRMPNAELQIIYY